MARVPAGRGRGTERHDSVAVLVPVKAFGQAKVRLAGVLDGSQRRALARAMAEHVLAAAEGMPRAVVCDDEEVADWALGQGALIVWQPERGLNRAVEAGVEHLAGLGAVRVVVAHADLPLAGHLGGIGRFSGVTVVPDRHGKGTNVLAVPTEAGFSFSYGPGSFLRHVEEAHRLGLAVRVVREPGLMHDIDVPRDLLAT